MEYKYYHQISYIKRTKPQNVSVYRLVWQLSLSYLLKPGIKWRMKM